MNIAKLTDEFSVTGQIDPTDLEQIAAMGFKSIFCHRPDGEGEQQPEVVLMMQAAKAYGINVIYLPVVPSKISASDLQAFAEQYAQAPKPILGYCRSGKRAMTLWAMSQAEQQTLEELQALSAQAQYNYQMWHDAMNLANHKIAQLQHAANTQQSTSLS